MSGQPELSPAPALDPGRPYRAGDVFFHVGNWGEEEYLGGEDSFHILVLTGQGELGLHAVQWMDGRVREETTSMSVDPTEYGWVFWHRCLYGIGDRLWNDSPVTGIGPSPNRLEGRRLIYQTNGGPHGYYVASSETQYVAPAVVVGHPTITAIVTFDPWPFEQDGVSLLDRNSVCIYTTHHTTGYFCVEQESFKRLATLSDGRLAVIEDGATAYVGMDVLV